MERIDRIFYRKINPSDFKKMYDIDKPATGGGQTYLEAAGITEDKMVDFLSIAERVDSPSDQRYTYTIKAYTLGNAGLPAEDMEFAPRNKRANYKISRQTMANKHSAWKPANGFPVPNTDPVTGAYTSVGNFVGIIDNLVILIIRTNYCHYYASFIDSATMPAGWPVGIGLEEIFTGDRRGIVNFTRYNVQFINNAAMPFGTVTKIPLEYHTGMAVTGDLERNRIIFGAPGTGKSYRINRDKDTLLVDKDDYERVTFHPDYTYSQFVGTYKPVSLADGSISYKFVPGPFMRVYARALKNILSATDANGNVDTTKIKPYILIVEEINRAKASAVFGDLFQLLDRNDKHVSDYSIQASEELKAYLCNEIGGQSEDYKDILLPDNLFIWATMNSADQGVFPMDTAFKRRWNFEYIGIDEEEIDPVTGATNVPGKFKLPTVGKELEWNKLRKAINQLLSSDDVKVNEDKLLGPFFINSRKYLKPGTTTDELDDKFYQLVENKVLMYLYEDAAKTKKSKVFADNVDSNRFSALKKAFEARDLGIFKEIDGKSFEDIYDSY